MPFVLTISYLSIVPIEGFVNESCIPFLTSASKSVTAGILTTLIFEKEILPDDVGFGSAFFLTIPIPENFDTSKV